METITLADFLSIISTYFEGILYPTDENGGPAYKDVSELPNEAKFAAYMDLFVRIEYKKGDLYPQSEEMLRKIFNGTKELPRRYASRILGQLDSEEISARAQDLSQEAIDGLKRAFEEKGVVILGFNLGAELKDVLERILKRIENLNHLFYLDKVKVQDGKIFYGGKTYKLIAKIMPSKRLQDHEKPYVKALLEVYSQDAKLPTPSLTLRDLNKPENLLYKEDFELERDEYFKIVTVMRQLRDSFFDGETQFSLAKDEAYDLIRDIFIGKKPGFSRIKECRTCILNLKFEKSDLGRQEIHMIGPAEKRGMLHILINDGRIQWIKEGEYNG